MRRTLIALGAVGVFLVAAAPAEATFPGESGRIAFLSTDIHTIRPDGTGDQLIADGYGATWSADGMHILFTRGVGSIFTMRADGSGQRGLTHGHPNEGAGGYSPNGRRILLSRSTSRPNQSVIASRRVDGTDERVLTRGHVAASEYSPSGRQILYRKDCSIWKMRRNGSHKRQLSHPHGIYCDNSPDYSPDGKHIVFERHNRIHVMRSNGSHQHRLGCGTAIYSPQYSPDGRKLLWTGRIGHGRSASSDIFTSTLRCTNPFRVTHYADVGGASEPSWQPLP